MNLAAQFVLEMDLPVSETRLERYRPRDSRGNPIGSNLEMLANYFWNIALSESLYPSLQAVEVAMRNSIDATLAAAFGTDRWWNTPRILLQNQLNEIVNIETKYWQRHQTAISAGRVVAQLNFGYWTTILSRPYDSRIWRYRQYLRLAEAFPHSGGALLHDVHQRFNEIRLLRNRVMHYEPIFDRPSLAQEHMRIHEALRWISPPLHHGIHTVDSFPDILMNGRARVYQKLHRFLGGP